MNNQTKSILKKTALLFQWLIFPPLFLFFSIKWKTPKIITRTVLTIIAPLTLVVLIAISWQGYDYYYYQIKRGSRSEIETKTGLIFPKFHTTNKRQFTYGPSFLGDFRMEYTVKLDTNNIQEFYEQIEQQIKFAEEQKGKHSAINWSMDNEGNYSFSEIDFETGNLELKINKKNAVVEILFGQM